MSNLGIPIPQKKIIKKNYTGLSSRTMTAALQSQPDDIGKYRSTMLQTPYGDIKILIGPDYKKSLEIATADSQPKPTMDYTRDLLSNRPETIEDEEILAEDFQGAQEMLTTKGFSNKKEAELGVGHASYDDLMAVAPADNVLNRYPLAPPKFTGYYSMMARNSNKQLGKYGFNPAFEAAPAMYYPNMPLDAPYNYPFTSYPYPSAAPVFFGY